MTATAIRSSKWLLLAVVVSLLFAPAARADDAPYKACKRVGTSVKKWQTTPFSTVRTSVDIWVNGKVPEIATASTTRVVVYTPTAMVWISDPKGPGPVKFKAVAEKRVRVCVKVQLDR